MPSLSTIVFDASPARTRRLFCWFFAAALLTGFQFFANGPYNADDSYRAMSGDLSGWFNNGRPLAVWLLQALQLTTLISDITPLPQIAGCAALAYLLARSLGPLTGETEGVCRLLGLSVMLSPFMVDPLIYVYDALPILLAIGLGWAGAVPVSERLARQFAYSFTAFLAGLCLYQTAVNHGVLSLALVTALMTSRDGFTPRQLRPVASALAAMIAAMIVYRTVITPWIIVDTWNQGRGTLLPLDTGGLQVLRHNLDDAWATQRSAFPGLAAWAVSGLAALGVAGSLVLAVGAMRRRQWLGAALCLAPVPLAALGGAGWVVLLQSDSYSAGYPPRVVTASAAALVLMACMALRGMPRLKPLIAACLVIHLMFCTSFQFAAYRAILQNARFNDGLTLSLRNDLTRLGTPALTQAAVLGTSPLAPVSQPAMQRYPLLSHLVIRPFKDTNPFPWNAQLLPAGIQLTYMPATAQLLDALPPTPQISNCLYRLYRTGNTAVLDFRPPHCAPGEATSGIN